MVANKKEQGKPTQGVQIERQEFLKKYGCQDERAYKSKRLQELANNTVYKLLIIHNKDALQKNKEKGYLLTIGQLPIKDFKEIFTKYNCGELDKVDDKKQLRFL